jgi:tetratricopeptide (TPR) repeat protein
MVGLRAGTYTLIIDAPGFLPARALAVVRTTTATPFTLTLTREPAAAFGPLPSDIQIQIEAANTLRDQGRLDQAIAAYREIQHRNPNLTSMGFVVAAVYRRKAVLASDTNERRESLARAIECYTAMLDADPNNEQAQTELTRVRAEAASFDN